MLAFQRKRCLNSAAFAAQAKPERRSRLGRETEAECEPGPSLRSEAKNEQFRMRAGPAAFFDLAAGKTLGKQAKKKSDGDVAIRALALGAAVA